MEGWKPKPPAVNQLLWLEECPNYYVRLIVRPRGEPFDPNTLSDLVQIKNIPEYLQKTSWF